MKVLIQATATNWQDVAFHAEQSNEAILHVDLTFRVRAVVEDRPAYEPCRIALDLDEWLWLLPLAEELALAEDFEQVGTLE